MLIPSPRHRPEDLALWRTMEAADLLNYRLRGVAGKAERSLGVVRAFAAAGPCYAAISWGKDSAVLAHLLWRLRGEPAGGMPAFRVRMAGIETPATDDAEREFLARFPLPNYRRVESPHEPADARPADEREPALARGIACCCRLAGTRRYVNGLRAEESQARRLGSRAGGVNGPSCSPLRSWRADDVFAYLAAHGVPTHPNYAMTLGGQFRRADLRVCMLGNHRGRQFGRLLWERAYYGDVLRGMSDLHPNMVPPG